MPTVNIRKAKAQANTTGQPTETSVLAAQAIQGLLTLANDRLPKTHIFFGVVLSSEAGPPATITATVNGQTIPDIRYIGAEPSPSDTVVLLFHEGRYISLGSLA